MFFRFILLKKIKLHSLLIVIAIIFIIENYYSLSQPGDSIKNQKTIILQDERKKFAPAQYFSKDTLFSPRYNSEGTLKPGYNDSQYHTPLQDTLYKRAMKLNVPTAVRFSHDFKIFAEQRALEQELEKGLPWQIALENLRIRPDILAPTKQELVQRQEMINNSMYVPFINNRVNTGWSFDRYEIAVMLGLAEDVSPIMTFDLQYTEEIEVVVYSLQASVIATVFKGIRQPGSHKFVWNGRDDKGRPVSTGDYIGEIRIGKSRFIRKRITIP